MYPTNLTTEPGGIYHGFGLYQGQPSYQQPVLQQTQSTQNAGMFADPFGTAMSGMMKGTLQPYVNRMTQNASNSLYGGLLDYQPQSMVAGDAGGTPINSQVPQGFNMQSALLNGEFGKRSWMK